VKLEEGVMLSKVVTGLVSSGLLLTAQAAYADHGNHYGRYGYGPPPPASDYAYARVVDVDPIVRHVRVSEPKRECWTETRYDDVSYTEPAGPPKKANPGAMILGGLIGAAVGNQFGHGDGRRAATVAGAVIGTAIGHNASTRPDQRVVTESRPYDAQRCEVRYDERVEDRIDGYRVTYEYNGIRQTTQLPYDPGDRIRVRVDVQPEG
jgi:uncharacterized protein YcfJ